MITQDELVIEDSNSGGPTHLLHDRPAAAGVLGTSELLSFILSTIAAEDLLKARRVCQFWYWATNDLLRLEKFRPHIRRELFLDSIDIGSVDGGVGHPMFFIINLTCTTPSIARHLQCITCERVKIREQQVTGFTLSGSGPIGLDLQRYRNGLERVPINGSDRYRAKFWLDMTQLQVNPMPNQLFNEIHIREGKWDVDLQELRDGSFQFVRNRALIRPKLGPEWERTFISQPPCQSIAILMNDVHLGRVQIATCGKDEGVRTADLLDQLETIAPTVAAHSAQATRAFLKVRLEKEAILLEDYDKLAYPEWDAEERQRITHSREEDELRAQKRIGAGVREAWDPKMSRAV